MESTNSRLRAIRRLSLVLRLCMVILRMFRVRIFRIRDKIFRLFIGFIRSLKEVSLINISRARTRNSLFLEGVFPVSLRFRRRLFSFRCGAGLEPRARLTIFLRNLTRTRLLPMDGAISSKVTRLREVRSTKMFRANHFVVRVSNINRTFYCFRMFPGITYIINLNYSSTYFFMFYFFFLNR